MDAVEATARASVQKTLSDYIRYVDTGRAELLAGLFTEETEYAMAPGIVAHRRDEIVPKVEELKTLFATTAEYGRLRHHLALPMVDILGPGQARAFTYFSAVAAAGLDHWGTYRDQLVEIDGEWRFQSRIITLEGAIDTSPVRQHVPAQAR